MTTPIGYTTALDRKDKQYLVLNQQQQAYRTRDIHNGIVEAARNGLVTVFDVTSPAMPWILKFDDDDEKIWRVVPDKALVDYAIEELEEAFDDDTPVDLGTPKEEELQEGWGYGYSQVVAGEKTYHYYPCYGDGQDDPEKAARECRKELAHTQRPLFIQRWSLKDGQRVPDGLRRSISRD